jgi:hypothetical protein
MAKLLGSLELAGSAARIPAGRLDSNVSIKLNKTTGDSL